MTLKGIWVLGRRTSWKKKKKGVTKGDAARSSFSEKKRGGLHLCPKKSCVPFLPLKGMRD
jgi:hypothetical protein